LLFAFFVNTVLSRPSCGLRLDRKAARVSPRTRWIGICNGGGVGVPVLYCPHCRSERLMVISVSADARTVQVHCPACHKPSILAYPPIRHSAPKFG
jgi:hypothetical protein